MSSTSKLLLSAVIFFIAAAGVAAYMFMGGSNVISGDNIDIAINGPASVKGGEVGSFEVIIANNNNTPLELADLVVTYPEGTRAADNVGKVLGRYRVSIGNISANQSVSESLKAIFYGAENTDKEMTIGFEYRTAGSNAIFAKEKKFSFHMASAPVTLAVVAPTDANSGQEITLSIKTASNTTEPLKGVLTRVYYPPGFIFSKAEPAPMSGTNNVWRLGDIPAQGDRTIAIHGVIEGQDDEVKSFQITSGAGGVDDTETTIIVPYSSVSQTISMKRPFVGLHVELAGLPDDTIAADSAGILHGSILWSNDLPSRIMDGQLVARFTGAVLDQRAVAAEHGFYRSTDNTITWDKSTVPQFANMDANDRGNLTFSLASQSLLTSGNSIFKQPEVDVDFVFTGTRIADASGSGGRIETVVRKKILFNSVTQLVARATHYVGPIVNTGPLPPKVGQATTYTIIWSMVNSSNDVTNAKVKANLPGYVQFVGNAKPSEEKVSYDERAGEVTWNIGTLKAGSGLTLPAREVAFQISFAPSLSQADLVVPLTGDATFSGTDDFTKAPRSSTKNQVTTELTSDPKSKEGEYRVAR